MRIYAPIVAIAVAGVLALSLMFLGFQGCGQSDTRRVSQATKLISRWISVVDAETKRDPNSPFLFTQLRGVDHTYVVKDLRESSFATNLLVTTEPISVRELEAPRIIIVCDIPFSKAG